MAVLLTRLKDIEGGKETDNYHDDNDGNAVIRNAIMC